MIHPYLPSSSCSLNKVLNLQNHAKKGIEKTRYKYTSSAQKSRSQLGPFSLDFMPMINFATIVNIRASKTSCVSHKTPKTLLGLKYHASIHTKLKFHDKREQIRTGVKGPNHFCLDTDLSRMCLKSGAKY